MASHTANRRTFVASIFRGIRWFRDPARWSLQVYCLSLILSEAIEVKWCEGSSMLPTFNDKWDSLMVEKITWRFRRQLGVGDVVVFVSPLDPLRLVCKRLIGLPGDRVIVDPVAREREYVTVPAGHIWVQGDNASNSKDSREYGPVPMGLIRGKVYCRLFPQFKMMAGTGLKLVVESGTE
ncbi:hypothetical protein SeMB42_g07586 [Synchytrium endobioticum]|uniref:Peptidase S26 domain-containing protein n=1 Tax=Synchytrium endobioticum TaxID=286115 RepID=A0A507CHR1_9FUNG|nr:hypothetical protein SeMB42_g07586 [Synchytrium endobioticum]TPX38859.1 hypothetical protein SeLEV6574_g07566 [Synchytrium endobioticum]